MENKISPILTEKDLDLLLNRSFTNLDFAIPANAKMLQAVGSWSLKVAASGLGFTSLLIKQVALGTFIVGTVAISYYYFQNQGSLSPNSPAPKYAVSHVLTDTVAQKMSALQTESAIIAEVTYTTKPKTVAKSPSKEIIKNENTHFQSGTTPNSLSTAPSETYEIHNRAPEEYIFPVLTAKEIKANEKEKKRLVKIVCRVSRDKRNDVARVPASADGSIGNFYMGSGEVTNNEYRTFLFDLLINGRKEDFLKSKPYQNLWKGVEGQTTFDTLAEVYFSEKKYNYFPVVNITPEGAEMFCKWLQDEVDAARLKDKEIPRLEIRLPTEKEWLYAARAGTPNAVYPWPLETVQNRKNYCMANFCIQKLNHELKWPLLNDKEKVDYNNYTSAGMMLRDPRIASIDVWSYNPNEFGLFGASGNAAEMVYDDVSKTIKVKGGSWASDYQHLKLNSEDEFTRQNIPSPKIGFRVCAFVKKIAWNE